MVRTVGYNLLALSTNIRYKTHPVAYLLEETIELRYGWALWGTKYDLCLYDVSNGQSCRRQKQESWFVDPEWDCLKEALSDKP